MNLNDIADEFKEEIRATATDLANSLPLSKPQIRAAFSDEEIKKLEVLIRSVNDATTENEKKAKFVENADAALGLLRKLGVGF